MIKFKTWLVYLIIIGSFILPLLFIIILSKSYPGYILFKVTIINFLFQIALLIWLSSLAINLLSVKVELGAIRRYKLFWWLCILGIFLQLIEGYYHSKVDLSPINNVMVLSSISEVCFLIIFIFSINTIIRRFYMIEENRSPKLMEYIEIYFSLALFLIGIAVIHNKARKIIQHYT